MSSHLLASFCNLTRPGTAMAVINCSSLECVPLPLDALGPIRSVTGLTANAAHVFATFQLFSDDTKGPARLLIMDRKDLSVRGLYAFKSASDVHSICATEDEIVAISTGTDEVLSLRLRNDTVSSETVLWKPEADGPREDRHHVNGVCRWHGELIVCAFGQIDPAADRREGFLYNVTRGRKMLFGVDQPHSVAPYGDSLAYCQSRHRVVADVNGKMTEPLPGYTRGIAANENALFVGTSVGRKMSRSRGVLLIDNPRRNADPEGRCTVNRLDPVTFRVIESVDLTAVSSELYDLLVIDKRDLNDQPTPLET